MAEQENPRPTGAEPVVEPPPGASAPSAPSAPSGGPATPPRILPWLVLYTVGRLAIAAALVLLLWMAGIGSYAGLLFGVLLSMPVAYLALRPARERLNEALVARRFERQRAKDDLRARLSGGE